MLHVHEEALIEKQSCLSGPLLACRRISSASVDPSHIEIGQEKLKLCCVRFVLRIIMPSGIIMPSVGKICTQCRPKKMEKCPLECEPLVAPLKAAAASDGGNGDEAMENLNNMVEVMRFVRHMDVADRTGHNGSTSKGKEGGRKRNRKLGGRTRLHRNVEKAKRFWHIGLQEEWREN